MRVGSGGVLLNHRSPYRVAETFLQLHAMFPGRIDLGVGRATSGPLIDFALQNTRSAVLPEENYEEQLGEVLHWFDGFADDQPFARVPFFEGVAGRPEPWVLGSSPGSAALAAGLGLPYCFAAFLNPAAAQTSLATYRNQFRPSSFRVGLTSPHSMVAVNVACAETEAQALRVRAAGELVRRHASIGRLPIGVASTADAFGQLGVRPDDGRAHEVAGLHALPLGQPAVTGHHQLQAFGEQPLDAEPSQLAVGSERQERVNSRRCDPSSVERLALLLPAHRHELEGDTGVAGPKLPHGRRDYLRDAPDFDEGHAQAPQLAATGPLARWRRRDPRAREFHAPLEGRPCRRQ